MTDTTPIMNRDKGDTDTVTYGTSCWKKVKKELVVAYDYIINYIRK